MGSKRFDGVRFRCYPDDHPPAHVHGFYAEVQVIVELLSDAVTISKREDSVIPGNGSRSDVRHVLEVAAKHYLDLQALWKAHHE